VIARVIGTDKAQSQSQTIYDPTCGSGSLLLKGADESPYGLSIYGQEMDNATAAMARMNMILHENPTAEIWRGNTLADPHFKDSEGNLKLFDFVVANPPFSTKSWSNGFDPEHDLYTRFEYGIPPKRNGDYAFVLHILSSMKSTGKGAIVMPHGVLFRGNAEEEIRRNLITKGYIKGVISLPSNLFYGTGIPACILLLDKEHAGTRKGIFMINASEGYMKDGAKNRLRHQDIRKIVDIFNGQIAIPGYSRLVPYDEIKENEYNLNIPRYIDNSEPEVIQDIEAHLKGGIPNRDIDALEKFWFIFPSLKAELFDPSYRAGYSKLKVDPDEIQAIIEKNSDYMDFFNKVDHQLKKWWEQTQPLIVAMEEGMKPKTFINIISERLLELFEVFPLIDKYGIYQKLMDYWTETLQDDVFMIVHDGWVANSNLVPSYIIAEQYFSEEQEQIKRMEEEIEELSDQINELELEHGDEEGLLSEAKSDAGNITKSALNKRIREIEGDKEFSDELLILSNYQNLYNKQRQLSKDVRKSKDNLSKRIDDTYPQIDISDIKTLTCENKWNVQLNNKINQEISEIFNAFLINIENMIDRYKYPLPILKRRIDNLDNKIKHHFEEMGIGNNGY